MLSVLNEEKIHLPTNMRIDGPTGALEHILPTDYTKKP